MSILRWDPFDDVSTLRRSMEKLFDEVNVRRPSRDFAVLAWEPAVEMFDAITLAGETKHEEEQKGRNYYRRELRHGAFSRTLPLTTEVKNSEAQATYKDGVLEVKIPKSERVKPASVKVQIG